MVQDVFTSRINTHGEVFRVKGEVSIIVALEDFLTQYEVQDGHAYLKRISFALITFQIEVVIFNVLQSFWWYENLIGGRINLLHTIHVVEN
jgi:hypothetical protein